MLLLGSQVRPRTSRSSSAIRSNRAASLLIAVPPRCRLEGTSPYTRTEAPALPASWQAPPSPAPARPVPGDRRTIADTADEGIVMPTDLPVPPYDMSELAAAGFLATGSPP